MHKSPLIPAFLALLALAGCSETREVLGLNAAPPDEFAVVDHPPLTMPPDYTLRPPRPGEASLAQNALPAKKAAQALYGEDKMEVVAGQGAEKLSTKNVSPSEQAVVLSSGALQADPQIRSELDREATQQVVASRRLIDNLLFWRDAKPAPAQVVNAVEEHKRLDEAKEKNLPVTSGATPVLGPSGSAVVQ